MANVLYQNMSREELLSVLDMYSKNWLAMDGVWFQSVEKKYGMEEAIEHDENAWRVYTVAEAKRIKEFLHLSDNPGLDGLKRALELRMYANLNTYEISIAGNVLVYRTVDCRVQTARKRKGMPYHPCKSVGIIEYGLFAKTIDERISCRCESCYPDITDENCACSWRFTLHE